MKKRLLALILLCYSSTAVPSEASANIWGDIKQYWKDTQEIVSMLVEDPKHVAAFTASSPWLVREVIKHVPEAAKHQKPKRILEIGSGPGTVTRGIVDRMGANDHLDAVEYLENLYKVAQSKFPKEKNPNVALHCSAFETWQPTHQEYDIIICTVPFTKLPLPVVKAILDKSYALLKKGGTFTYISLIGAQTIGHIKFDAQERKEYRQVVDTLEHWRDNKFTWHKESVLCNVTPAWVYHLTKK